MHATDANLDEIVLDRMKQMDALDELVARRTSAGMEQLPALRRQLEEVRHVSWAHEQAEAYV